MNTGPGALRVQCHRAGAHCRPTAWRSL